MARRWAVFLLRNRALMLVALALLSLSAVWGVSQIRFEDGMRQVFASQNQVFEQFEENARNVPQADADIFILVSSDMQLTKNQLRLLRDFTLDGQLVEGVTLATSIFSLQKFNEDSGDLVNLIGDDIVAGVELSEILNEASGRGLVDVSLINDELTRTVVHFAIDGRHIDMDASAPLIAEINALARRLEEDSGLQLSISGMNPIRHRIVTNLASEQILLNIVGGIFGSLVSLLLFRSIWVGALNGVAPTFALFFTLGGFGLAGISVNVITNSVTVLILVLAMADSIHMTHELRRKLAKGDEIGDALRKMLIEIGPPSVLTSLTTMMAFGSLYYSQSALIKSFATAGILGLFAALVCVFAIHPLVYWFAWKYAPVRKALSKPLRQSTGPAEMVVKTSRMLTRWRNLIVPAGMAILALLSAQFFPIQTDHRFQEYLYEDDAMVEILAEIEAISAPTQSISITLRPKTSEGALLSERYLTQLGKAHDLLAAKFPDNKIVSLRDVQRAIPVQDTEKALAELKELLETMPEPARHSLIGKSRDAFIITLLTKDDHSRVTRELVEQIHDLLTAAQFEHLDVERPTGLIAMAAFMSDVMIKELVMSFLIAAMACPLLIALWFRRWSYGMAALLPNLLPIIIVGTYLLLSGHAIQFTSAIALTIAFGVAVDDTIHLVNRYHLLRLGNPSGDREETIASAVRHVAPALITTTCVLAAGLSSSLLSSMPTVLFFGLLCVGIFVLALLADLLLLPPALALFERLSEGRNGVTCQAKAEIG